LHVAAPRLDAMRGTWLRLARDIALNGRVAVLAGSLLPSQLETRPGRQAVADRVSGTCAGQAGTGVMPEPEIRKPLPLAVQVTLATADSQRNGPAPVTVP
jgi:hypothetical protein